MKRLVILCAIGAAMLMVLSPSLAATNLNSSRSNIYRVVWPEGLVSQAQATAMLAELDKLGPMEEVKLKQWLQANFKRFDIQQARIKKISILLEQRTSCTASTEACKGKWAGPGPNARNGASAVCYCYGSLTSPSQVAKVNKALPIRILLLTELKQEDAALALTVTNEGRD